VLYVLVVLAVAIVWGTPLAAAASVLSAAVFAYLFVPPDSRFEPAGRAHRARPGRRPEGAGPPLQRPG
jgi:K+-sensing histidine kinase KdpD